ncbi:MAG: GNAT family N-acetyltransferase [Oscillospiraceae bacterium]|nr:GNAT family N-acetyltransferase [Oscillospiraceae bacterium]
MTFDEILLKIKTQLARDLNCAPGDFDRPENVITPACAVEGRRTFTPKPPFFQAATFGGNAVFCADERLRPWLAEWARVKKGFWLFEQPNWLALERELEKYGLRTSSAHHMFAPLPGPVEVRADFPVRWLEQEELAPFYGRAEFSNALCDRFHPERPDVLAVAALDGEGIVGMAGCSADAPGFWQIGVDVLPEHRRRGTATALVSLLRNEVFRRGALPYYGTSPANIASMRTALSSGFVPAWVEAESSEIE